MTRLYPEMEKGALSERGVMFGREQNGQPGEAHYWAQRMAARGPTQLRAIQQDPSYNPSMVENAAANAASVLGDLAGGRHHGHRGGGRRFISGGAPVIVENNVLAQCPPGQRLLHDETGRPYCGPAPRGALADMLEGLGADFTADRIQKTWMSHRDFAPVTGSTLPSIAQHFEQGIVRPERSAKGLQVLAENGAAARVTRNQRGRLRAELKGNGAVPVEVNALGELEPRMGVWGHEASDRLLQWFSPPGPRSLPDGGRVVPTQESRLANVSLSGLGDLAGAKSKKLLQFATAQNQAIQAAAAKGDVQAAINAAAVTPWQNTNTGVTQQQVDAKLATPLGYQDIAAKIARATGVDPNAKLPTTIPVALPTGQQAQQLAPDAPATPIQKTAPPPLQNVVAPGMPSAPPTALGPQSNLPPATAPTLAIPLPGAPPPPALLSPPVPAYSSGGGGGGGSYVDTSAPADAAAPAPPSGPLAFLSATVTLPLVGPVPTWGVLGAAAGAFLIWRKRKARAAGAKTNPKRKKTSAKRSGSKGKR